MLLEQLSHSLQITSSQGPIFAVFEQGCNCRSFFRSGQIKSLWYLSSTPSGGHQIRQKKLSPSERFLTVALSAAAWLEVRDARVVQTQIYRIWGFLPNSVDSGFKKLFKNSSVSSSYAVKKQIPTVLPIRLVWYNVLRMHYSTNNPVLLVYHSIVIICPSRNTL